MSDEAARCSYQARQADEPLAGTAPHAGYWVLVEQPGPWGREALTESHLAPEVGQALIEWAANSATDSPVRLGVIRRPGRHADHNPIGSRTVLFARSESTKSRLQSRRVQDAREILAWDLPTLMATPQQESNTTTALLVCTNARRDQCCALLGRPLVAALAQSVTPDTVIWETSHLGGHRFAPTLVDLPSGYLFGGASAATRTVDACRGRSSLPAPAQAAELAVMRELGWTHPSPLTVSSVARDTGHDSSHYTVTAPEHPAFQVSVVQQTLAPRPESCGKADVAGICWQATITR